MKRTPNSRRDRHLAKFTIFLVMVALTATVVGCSEYSLYYLTITSTEGGNVTMPREGRDIEYFEGRKVFLEAEAETGYLFANWTGDADTIDDVNADSTFIIMNGNYSIQANFVLNITKITDWFGLDRVRNNLSGTYVLMNDLHSGLDGWKDPASPTADDGMGWEPIGDWDDPFTGSFDGQGYEVRNLSINRATEQYVGLFGHVKGEKAVIQNVTLVNATVTGKRYVGGLVGRNEGGNVSKSYSTGTVTGAFYVGGLVGRNQGIVETSYSRGSVNGSAKYVGGLVGSNQGSVRDSHSQGSVNGSAEHVGGLVGFNKKGGSVSACYFTGSVSGRSQVGGVAGNNSGTVENSHSSGNVTGSDMYVGGLVGWNHKACEVKNSYSSSNVTGKNYVGGLVGRNYGENTVSDSYFSGSVTGDVGVGGLVGFNRKSYVKNSHYNLDEVLINGENIITIGALFGEDFDQWLANDKFLAVNETLSRENDICVVNNVTDFKALLAFGQNDGLKFRLTNDLDLGNEPNFYIPYLAGEFDGNNQTISNLSFNFDFVYNVGLFGCLVPGGRATEVGIEDVDITGGSFVGGLVGSNWEGDVIGSYSTGSVSGYDYVGGLAGSNDAGTMEGCNSRVSVSGNSHVGGLVGRNDKEGTVEDCYSTGALAGNSSVGGVAGSNGGTVRKSCSGSNVIGSKNYVGGLVGLNEATVEKSYSTGTVSGEDYIGGLIGQNGYLASNSYSTGNVSGNNWVGGLVGQNILTGDVNRCYSAGKVTGNDPVGGLVGQNSQGGDVTRSFWDTDSSGQLDSAGGTGKNTTEMQNSATFTGWGIIAVVDHETRNKDYVWNIVDGEGYPFLSWQSTT